MNFSRPLSIALALLLLGPLATAAQTPAPATGPAATMPRPLPADASPAASPSAAPFCPIGVIAVVASRSADPRATTGTDFAAFVWSPQGPGVASGTLWVNASGRSYHVPFTKRGVLPRDLSGLLDPIAFHLPVSGALESVFVDTLDDPSPGPCGALNRWTPGVTQALSDRLLTRIRLTAQTAPIAAAEIADPDRACLSPSTPARIARAEPPATPPLAVLDRAKIDVSVLVSLDARSNVVDARIDKSVNGALDAPAIASARKSIFQTAVSRCRPIPTSYLFLVQFAKT